ncbi:MAG: 16S rRNA (cytosine(967)-C(5))-methyltransferase RsmB [Clostridia bacterium]
MSNYTRVCYDTLLKIYRDKAFSSITLYRALENEENADLIHKIVLGVLDQNIELEYIIKQLVKKPTQNSVEVILKIGIYCLKHLNGVPDYAVVNNCIELTKSIGKQAVSSFVNGVLRSAQRGEYTSLPDESDVLYYFSIKYSKPIWLVEKLLSDYGKEATENIISVKPYELSHIRPNKQFISLIELENYLKSFKIEYFTSPSQGFLVRVTPDIKKLFKAGKITYQSITSMFTVKALDVHNRQNVLDICSAPGGKAMLIAEQNPNGTVTACDLYEHRIELVSSYAKRMAIKNVETKIMDATIFEPKFVERFDRVLVDAPCSALGVIRKQPDILLNRLPSDILILQDLQKRILANASRYVKRGGVLVYSTCTITKEENIMVVEDFLAKNPEFSLSKIDLNYDNDGYIQFLPAGAVDGFFIARFIKK